MIDWDISGTYFHLYKVKFDGKVCVVDMWIETNLIYKVNGSSRRRTISKSVEMVPLRLNGQILIQAMNIEDKNVETGPSIERAAHQMEVC